MGAEPFCAALGGRVIEPSLERGLGYLARVSPDGAAAFARFLEGGADPFLWITSRDVGVLEEDGHSLHVSPDDGGMDPKRLGDLRIAAARFLASSEGSVLVLDCLELLALHNGVERVVRTIEGIHDDATTKGGILIVCADPRTANPRLIAWLERELEAFPPFLAGTSTADLQVA